MAKQQANPFEAIDNILGEASAPQAQASSPLEALRSFAKQQGYRITSANEGRHNPGSRHYRGEAIDIDHRNIDKNKLIAAAQAAGFRVLDERTRPPGQAEWSGPHFHIDTAGRPAAKKQPVAKQGTAKQKPVSVAQAPPVDIGRPYGKLFTTDAQGNLVRLQENKRDLGAEVQGYVQKNMPQPAKLAAPSASATQASSSDFSGIDQILSEASQPQKPAPVEKPKAGPLEFISGIAGGALKSGVDAIQQEFSNQISQPKDLTGFLSKLPQVATGAGAFSEAARLVNGITQLPADIGNAIAGKQQFDSSIPKIPTGELDKITERSPVFSSIGRLAPYAFGEGAVAGAAKSLPYTKRIFDLATKTAPRRVLSGATVNAAESALADPNEGGLGERAKQAGIGFALGAGLGGAAEGLSAIIAKRFPGKTMKQLTPDETAEVQAIMKAEEARTSPREISDLNQGFKQRENVAKDLAGQEFQKNVQLETQPTSKTVDLLGPDGNPVSTVRQGLPTARDLAIAKTADVPAKAPELLGPEGRPLDLATAKPKAAELLDSQGRPLDLGSTPQPRDLGQPSNVIDLASRPKPEAKVDLVGPTGEPLPKPQAEATAPVIAEGNVQSRPSGGQVYTQGRAPDDVNRLAQAIENQSQILALEDAKKLLADKKAAGLLTPEEVQKQTDVLNLFEEAGRTGKTFDAMRREIQEGEGRISKELGKAEVKQRDSLSPFAITVRQRKPQTEVSNLIKRLGSAEAARDQLRQIAGKYGITPTTKGKTVTAVARNIAQQIANNPKGRLEFTDIYLNAHNFKTGGIKTGTDAPRGYPLRTIEGANIGTEAASIPQGALNQNAIAEQFSALEQLKNAPDISPEVKQLVTKVTDNPNVSFKDIRKMRQLVSESLQKFCGLWGLK